MEVYFVRHGKTLWNLEERIQGWEDSELLENDDAHIKAAKNLKGMTFDYICSSDLKRAVKTKEKILKILDLIDDKNEHFEFREVGFGDLEGVNISIVKTKYKDIWFPYKMYIEDFDPGKYIKGFESVKKVRERALKKIYELKEKFGDDAKILIISHGSLISILQNIGKTMKEPAIIPDNGEVVKLIF